MSSIARNNKAASFIPLNLSLNLVAVFMFLAPAYRACGADAADEFQAETFHGKGGKMLPYRILKPKDYDKSKQYPLVLFFHGYGERGTDNEKQLKHCVKLFLKEEVREKYPCFVVVPQAPGAWLPIDDKDFVKPRPFKGATEALNLAVELKDTLVKDHSVDADRVYISGASNGGYAVWYLLHEYPKAWAAAVPMCGGGDPSAISVAKDVPIWAFHGAKDPTVPVARTKELIAALEAAGGHPKFTEYKDAHHMDAADRAFKEKELLPWLFEQKRGK